MFHVYVNTPFALFNNILIIYKKKKKKKSLSRILNFFLINPKP
jgi:hypothetical protein